MPSRWATPIFSTWDSELLGCGAQRPREQGACASCALACAAAIGHTAHISAPGQSVWRPVPGQRQTECRNGGLRKMIMCCGLNMFRAVVCLCAQATTGSQGLKQGEISSAGLAWPWSGDMPPLDPTHEIALSVNTVCFFLFQKHYTFRAQKMFLLRGIISPHRAPRVPRSSLSCTRF